MKKRIAGLLLSLALCLSLLPTAALAATSYTVTCDPNYTGGQSTTIDVSSGTVALPNTVSRDGYTLVGWSENSDGTGTVYLPQETYEVTGNTTLYALWTEANAAPTAYVKIGGVTLNSTNPYYHNYDKTANNSADGANAMLVNGVLVLKGLDVSASSSQKGIWWSYKKLNESNNIIDGSKQDNDYYDLVIYLLPGTTNTVSTATVNCSAINGETGSGASGPSLTVRGKGTLSATGQTYGIWAWKNITFEGGARVTATGNTKSAVLNNTGTGTITVQDGASLTATGNEYGVGTDNENEGKLVVKQGAVLTASGKTKALCSLKTVDFNSQSAKASNNTDGSNSDTLASGNTGLSTLGMYKYIQVGALSTQHRHVLCGAACTHNGDHTELADWAGVSSLSAITTSGNYYLTENVTLTSKWEVPEDKTINLCLNGKTIRSQAADAVIQIGSDRTLVLTDCQDSGTITFSALGTEGAYDGVRVNCGAFTMYGGTITYCNNGVDFLNGGTFELYGGTISNHGCGVKLDGSGSLPATFKMYGGTITGNNAGVEFLYNGSNGSFELYGGTISKSSTQGVRVTHAGTFTMEGGRITENYNGGVFLYAGTFNLKGGEITGNTAYSDLFGGVTVDNSGTFIMSGGKLCDNHGDTKAVNLYLYPGHTVTTNGLLLPSSKIGVSTQTAPTAEAPVTIASGYQNYVYFTSDDPAYSIYYSITDDTVLLTLPQTGGNTPPAPTPSDPTPPDPGESDTPSGDTPSGDTPSGDTPSGGTPSGDTPSGDTPSGDTPSGGGSSSGSSGGSSSSASSTVTVPVSSGSGTVNVRAEVSQNGTATVEISDRQIESVAKNGSGTVTVDVSALKNVERVEVPAQVVETTNRAENTGLTVALPDGSVALDSTALESVTTGQDITVSVQQVPVTDLTAQQQKAVGDMANIGLVVDVDLFVGGTKQSSFNGGKLTISIPYTPKRGEDTSKLTVWFIRDDGTIENKGGYYDAARGCFVFETDHLSRYVLVNVSARFADVPANAYFADAVVWAVQNGVTGGVTETTFAPYASCTRAQIVTFLYRYAVSAGLDVSVGEDTNILSYNDAFEVPEYAFPAFQWACGAGITQGNHGNLMPNQSCTRTQAVAFLYRFAALAGMDAVTMQELVSGFGDAAQVPGYALAPFNWALAKGIVQGNDGNLMPSQTCTRAQIVSFLFRMLGQ